MYGRRGVVAVHFLLQSQGGTSEFMYKALILGNKQFFSNVIDREATQVSYSLLKLPSHSLYYTVQITHNLNGTLVYKSKKRA